jgi:hypothetical protein
MVLKKIKCFFGFHEHVFVSKRRNGIVAADWAMNVRPEYDSIERCSCGHEITKQYLSYADKPLNKR